MKTIAEKFHRISVFKTDINDQPHCIDGPSRIHIGGQEEYHWHGVPVSRRWVIAPESISIHELEKLHGLQKVACADLFGWHNLPNTDEYNELKRFRELHFAKSNEVQYWKKDRDENLHSDNGPSRVSIGGNEEYHWHGTPVPKHWIMDPNTYSKIEMLGNNHTTDTKFACAEIFGWASLPKTYEFIALRAEFYLFSDLWFSVRDRDGRLHCHDGPSIYWKDGWSAYFWRNVYIPKHWIVNKEKLTVSEVLSTYDDQITVGAEIIGWKRFPYSDEVCRLRFIRDAADARLGRKSFNPQASKVDSSGELHCADGPSIVWGDGWKAYSWHGIWIPEHWIVNKSELTAAEVLAAENVDQRAAGAEIVGWGKIEAELGARIIDDSGSEDIGQLIELTLPGLGDPVRFLKAWCPRNRWIYEAVPAFSDVDGLLIKTALHAQAWRVGETQADYVHPITRT